MIEILSTRVHAGGPSGNIDLGITVTLILMAVGGIPLGLISILGCLVGLWIRSILKKRIMQRGDGQNQTDELKAALIGARATIIVGIVTCITSIIAALISK